MRVGSFAKSIKDIAKAKGVNVSDTFSPRPTDDVEISNTSISDLARNVDKVDRQIKAVAETLRRMHLRV